MAGRAHVAAIGALLLAGCGSPDSASLPVACLKPPAAIAGALARAPAPVTLAGGTRLSQCVSAADDGELQALGVSFTRVVDGLRERAATSPAAALRLGYLVGAVRRGAAATPGVAAQLARRVEQTAALDAGSAEARDELARGIALGEAGG